MGAVRRSTVVGGIVVVCVVAGRSLAFVGRSFVGCWPSFSSLRVVVELLGRLLYFWAAGVVCGGVGCVTWHAVDPEGARVVVEAGDVAAWSSRLFVGRSSSFVDGRGCLCWWGLLVVDVVAGRIRCGEGGGCGVKKEDVLQYVTRVTFGSTRVRSRARPNFCSVHRIYHFVVSIVQFCSVYYTIL